MKHLRNLNENGIKQFGYFLDSLTTASPHSFPAHLLDDPAASCDVPGGAVLEKRRFETRYDFGCYLTAVLTDRVPSAMLQEPGIWAWLSMFYFDQLCKKKKDGRLVPGERAKWIPDSDYRRYYRHLVSGPYNVCRVFARDPSACKALLLNTLDTPGELYEQVAARQHLVTNRGLITAMSRMYIDPRQGKLQRGVGGKGPGSARRLAFDVLVQFDLTFDLYSMSSDEIAGVLPREFDKFKQGAVSA